MGLKEKGDKPEGRHPNGNIGKTWWGGQGQIIKFPPLQELQGSPICKSRVQQPGTQGRMEPKSLGPQASCSRASAGKEAPVKIVSQA